MIDRPPANTCIIGHMTKMAVTPFDSHGANTMLRENCNTALSSVEPELLLRPIRE